MRFLQLAALRIQRVSRRTARDTEPLFCLTALSRKRDGRMKEGNMVVAERVLYSGLYSMVSSSSESPGLSMPGARPETAPPIPPPLARLRFIATHTSPVTQETGPGRTLRTRFDVLHDTKLLEGLHVTGMLVFVVLGRHGSGGQRCSFLHRIQSL